MQNAYLGPEFLISKATGMYVVYKESVRILSSYVPTADKIQSTWLLHKILKFSYSSSRMYCYLFQAMY